MFSSSRFDHITPLLHQLHWLKASERISFKCAVLVYKCLHGSAPSYLVDELCQVADVEARQRLSSASSSSLIVGRTRLSTVGDQAVPVAASLSGTIYSSTSLLHFRCIMLVFRARLKTPLFTIFHPLSYYSTYAVTVIFDTLIFHVNYLWLLIYVVDRVPVAVVCNTGIQPVFIIFVIYCTCWLRLIGDVCKVYKVRTRILWGNSTESPSLLRDTTTFYMIHYQDWTNSKKSS